MIVVVDYGMGNLRSAQKGLEKAGYEAVISEDPKALGVAAGIVLPGVGAFGDCYEGLKARGFVQPLLDAAGAGKPLLGICVGMQLLFEGSEEGVGCEGLGILPGRVVRFPDMKEAGVKVPHMGWNQLSPSEAGQDCPLFRHVKGHPFVYFVHSYYPEPSESDICYATTEHGVEFTSVAGRGSIFAVQFHPEKSQAAGIGILRGFGEYVQETSASVRVNAE